MMPRSEFLPYEHSNSPTSYVSRILLFCRQHAAAVTATLTFIVFVTILTSEEIVGVHKGGLRTRHGSSAHWGGAAHPGYFTPQSAQISPFSFRFAMVTDLDQLSRVPGTKSKPKFQSYLLPGVLNYDPTANRYSIDLSAAPRTLISNHNEAGRGMELSELTLYQNRLLSFDDRTGSIFEVLSKNKEESYVVPRFVITEGEGDTDKGMKWEWATVKDNNLYLGSMGKEYTREDGSIANTNNLWIATVDTNGNVERRDWMREYTFVRGLLNAQPPGYVIHEAVLWSEMLKKWIFIPRRVSSDTYDDVLDEKKGTNKVVLVNEDFTEGQVVDIQMKPSDLDPLHGFSTAAFVPNSDERHVIAVRSVEEDCAGPDESACKQRSYVIVFDVVTGVVLMDEVKIDQNIKYEGVEFVDVSRTSPFH